VARFSLGHKRWRTRLPERITRRLALTARKVHAYGLPEVATGSAIHREKGRCRAALRATGQVGAPRIAAGAAALSGWAFTGGTRRMDRM
jgi:hypothetical protein